MTRRYSHAALAAIALLVGADGLPLSVAKTRARLDDPQREKKKPYSAADSTRLRKAELKRQRKRTRNLNALLLPGPRWEVQE